ncbi:hypothetical protein AaE_004391 [Aphanomyces astaci]|uniref:Uncharacterized protein n=1 Tax=Aphanomyces astaci TaxID=112090 RepID=A0A6A5AML4_APHAT|nr:hypothetical protein AaE_004391 [Aphanomyces astaci]
MSSRRHFDSDRQPKAYDDTTNPGENAVRLVCCPHSAEAARTCFAAAQDIMSCVPPEAMIHVNTEQSMHVTLFHTSHPHDRRPFSPAIRTQELTRLRDMAAAFPSFTLSFHSIIVASSGSIIMLFDDPRDTVHRLRHEAHATFPSLPASQTTTIVHTTLARLMSPSISADSLVTVQDKCRVVTARLRREAFTVLLSSLWYVEETHYFSAGSGPRTSIPLPPPVLHVPEA